MTLTEGEIEVFRQHILETGVLDPEGTHHEFVSGLHGQKLDFDTIPNDSELYKEWVDVNVRYIADRFDPLPTAILGVANGTNRLALDVARKLDSRVLGLESEKDPNDSRKLYLSDRAEIAITMVRPELVVVVEDVGTQGTNSVQPAKAAKNTGAKHVEVVTTWKRRAQLEKLDEAEIPYRAIIDQELPTYTSEQCRKLGFCALGWDFIERSK